MKIKRLMFTGNFEDVLPAHEIALFYYKNHPEVINQPEYIDISPVTWDEYCERIRKKGAGFIANEEDGLFFVGVKFIDYELEV